MIKDTSQIKKSENFFYPEFTFKVIKSNGFKEMKGYKSENKILELEIVPLDLEIEGLKKINRVQFYFFTQDPPRISPFDRHIK